MKMRQKIGYGFVLLALFSLFILFLASILFSSLPWTRRLLSALIVLAPLFLFGKGAIKRDLRAYQALALLAPVYFFIGGLIFLWANAYLGYVVMFLSVLLQLGTILHNYQRRRKR